MVLGIAWVHAFYDQREENMRKQFSGTLEENINELEYLLKTISAGFSISRQEKQIVINHDGKMFAVVSTKFKGMVNTEFMEAMRFSDKWVLMNDIFKFSLSVEDDKEEMDTLWRWCQL